MEYSVNSKEKIYLGLKVFFTIAVLIGFIALFSINKKTGAMMGVFGVYALLIGLFFFIRHAVAIGYLRGNAVRVSEDQFPELFKIAEEYSEKLQLASTPSVFIIQAGGILNAFAARFIGKEYVVLYSEIVEAAYEKGIDALSFVIGHELGHIKRKHMTMNFILFPSLIIPFLGSAYSRACEYTCDNIGKHLNPNGAVSGMLILAVGKYLYEKVNINRYLEQIENEKGFWVWFAEIISSHPNLPKRIKKINQEKI